MLKKLIKHDIRAIYRALMPILPIFVFGAIIASTLLGFSIRLDSRFFALGLLSGATLVLGFIACNTVMRVFIYVRYFRSIATDEAYLTFTLPVTGTQLLCSKIISTMLWELMLYLVDAIVLFTSLLIIGSLSNSSFVSTVVGWLKDALGYFFNYVFSDTEQVATLVIALIALIFRALSSLLTIFFSITIGSFANRLGVLKGIFTYLGITWTLKIITDIMLYVPLSYIGSNSTTWYPISYTCMSAVFYAIVSVVLFLLTKRLYDKKVNLN